MTTEELAIVVSAATTVVVGLGGVWLGWRLGKRTAQDAAEAQRKWDERQTIRERQEVAAEKLDEAVIEAGNLAPTGIMLASEARESIQEASARLREGWIRTTVLTDKEIERRWRAADMTLFIAAQDARFAPEDSINFYAVGVALSELRIALAAYLVREEPAPAEYPDTETLIQLANPGGRNAGLSGINNDLIKRRVGG